MPIANGFLTDREVADEYFFELAPAFCNECGMFQLMEQPNPERMFHAQYAFYSSTSRYMQLHFESFAKFVMEQVLHKSSDPFVVELGSNDGIMLRHFKQRGIPGVQISRIRRRNLRLVIFRRRDQPGDGVAQPVPVLGLRQVLVEAGFLACGQLLVRAETAQGGAAQSRGLNRPAPCFEPCPLA